MLFGVKSVSSSKETNSIVKLLQHSLSPGNTENERTNKTDRQKERKKDKWHSIEHEKEIVNGTKEKLGNDKEWENDRKKRKRKKSRIMCTKNKDNVKRQKDKQKGTT